jgi:hypothetical protein
MAIAGSGLDRHYEALVEAGGSRDADSLERLLFSTPSVVAASLSRGFRRRAGIYLTSRKMSELVAHQIKTDLLDGAIALDPSFGCGDLLLACAAHLPLGRNVDDTVAQWSHVVRGYELNSKFVEIAKSRLILLAKLRHRTRQDVRPLIRDDSFPNLVSGDFVELSKNMAEQEPRSIKCFVMNPPFTRLNLPIVAKWGRGKKSAAALFLDRICDIAAPQSHIVGILPEVLRCGTSYSRLRKALHANAREVSSRWLGRFSADVDIDVFLWHLQKTGMPCAGRPTTFDRVPTLSDIAEIAVGAVVPHRDPQRGPWRKYITVHDVPAWSTACFPERSRRYWGRVFEPPFLVVRRTSSPDQKHRAVASVIVGSDPTAVENHLIVIRPRDRSTSSCRRLLTALSSQQVDDQLNATMRCRHLTVSSLGALTL